MSTITSINKGFRTTIAFDCGAMTVSARKQLIELYKNNSSAVLSLVPLSEVGSNRAFYIGPIPCYRFLTQEDGNYVCLGIINKKEVAGSYTAVTDEKGQQTGEVTWNPPEYDNQTIFGDWPIYYTTINYKNETNTPSTIEDQIKETECNSYRHSNVEAYMSKVLETLINNLGGTDKLVEFETTLQSLIGDGGYNDDEGRGYVGKACVIDYDFFRNNYERVSSFINIKVDDLDYTTAFKIPTVTPSINNIASYYKDTVGLAEEDHIVNIAQYAEPVLDPVLTRAEITEGNTPSKPSLIEMGYTDIVFKIILTPDSQVTLDKGDSI